MHGGMRRRVRLELGLLAYNLLCESTRWPSATSSRWAGTLSLVDTEVAGFAGVGRFVVGLLDDIRIVDSPELTTYTQLYQGEYFLSRVFRYICSCTNTKIPTPMKQGSILLGALCMAFAAGSAAGRRRRRPNRRPLETIVFKDHGAEPTVLDSQHACQRKFPHRTWTATCRSPSWRFPSAATSG